MITIIKRTIPMDEVEQIQLGDGTETLSTRIWLNNKPQSLHNIYILDEELDITTPLTRKLRSILVGDFNATYEMWCIYHNRAGLILIYQLQNIDNFCLMNHPQVLTTINNTEIDSILPVDMVPFADRSISPGLFSDHLAILLEITLIKEMAYTTRIFGTLSITHYNRYNKHRY